MRSEGEIREELEKLYKGRKWREENAHLVDIGIVIDGKLVPPKQVLIEFERAEERIETLEWILAKNQKQALCGVCKEPVPYAFYDEKGQLRAEEGHCICSEGNIAYHFEPSKDCWGKRRVSQFLKQHKVKESCQH